MAQPRKLTDHQRAAHLLLPMVTAVIKELDEEAHAVEMEAKAPKKSHDVAADWKEMAVRCRARVDGAGRIAALLQRVARG